MCLKDSIHPHSYAFGLPRHRAGPITVPPEVKLSTKYPICILQGLCTFTGFGSRLQLHMKAKCSMRRMKAVDGRC